MKVSVVVPVYNKAPFVRESLQSILDQTFPDLELIAVDDKSTDNSLDVMRSMHDPRLRIIELPVNSGPCVAINVGIEAAQCEYIARMDADDIAVPERFALQVAFMDAHPEVGVSSGQLQLFDAEEGIWNFPLQPDACAAQLVFGVPVAHPATIIRHSVLQQHNLRYHPAWPINGFDWMFWLHVAPYTRFANLPDILLRYRRGAQNIGHGRNQADDFTFLQRAAFNAFAIPFTEEELDLTLMGSTIFKLKPDAARVKALRQWYDKLVELNRSLHFAPEEAFAARVEQQWNKLFHYLPQYGLAPALAHLRHSRHRRLAHLSYALKYRINAGLGRVPKG